MLDTLELSRIQFALNISFHILFPTITIGLAWLLFYFKFPLTFALGVVSGITMSFQFGTNWPGFMETVGNIAGPLLGYEVLTAFFLEATFLGIMLFGFHRVPNWLHTLATFLVAAGTSLSAFWIIALNSWMQTPAGFEIREGVVHATNWFDVIFNPSMPYRLVHMMLASFLTSTFLVAGISAYRLLKGDKKRAPKLALSTAIVIAAILSPMQAYIGDLHGLNTFEHQPQKISAMEGVWETENGAPLLLFALPDEEQRKNHLEIGIPKLASLILTHSNDGEIVGLNEFKDGHPPVAPLFFGFRVMVAIGVFMIVLSWYGLFRIIKQKAFPIFYLKSLVLFSFAGWIATLAGWYVTEIGRQPWLVTGILRTADAVTSLPPANVGLTLTLYLCVYSVLLIAYIHTVFVMARRSVDVEEFETTAPINFANETTLQEAKA